MLPQQNKLKKPAVVSVPHYETLLSEFKANVVNHIRATDSTLANQVESTLNNPAEVSTKLIEACTAVLQTRAREINQQALQCFATFAKGSNLDAKVAELGVFREIITPADTTVYPPVLEELEDDESLLNRYFLALYSYGGGGTAPDYKFKVLTMGDRPKIEFDTRVENRITITLEYLENDLGGKIKDANPKRSAPGQVTIPILAHAGNGVPSNQLIQSIQTYFSRADVPLLTDQVLITKAVNTSYAIVAGIKINKGADTNQIKERAEQNLKTYVDSKHRLGETIEASYLSYLLHDAGAVSISTTVPLPSVDCLFNEAPFCSGITVTVETV